MMTFTQFAVLALATWRISSLLSLEKGPWDLCEKLRIKVGVDYSYTPPVMRTFVAGQMTCVWCVSLWIGLVLLGAFALCPTGTFYACIPFALSSATIAVQVSRPMQYYIDKLRG